MISFASRCLSILAISLLLAACQSAPPGTEPATDDPLGDVRLLEQSLASGQLSEAESRLKSLQLRAGDDDRLEPYQRQLAEAYLLQGQAALQTGDLDRAAKALSQARQLMPQAPALTTGLGGAIAQARQTELDAADLASNAAEQAAAQAQAARGEQARQLRQAAERQAAALRASQLPQAAQAPAKPSEPAAAANRVIALPMLDSRDNPGLYRLLDAVAAEVVNCRCTVRIQVRQAKDYLWLAPLLDARIKRLDPSFSPSMSQLLEPEQIPQLVLSPQR
ncbi:tetratricopeptide repeat protein [Pseudomonas sp. sp1636]|uniref:tetratricopeptide repeat protein n=1 Tax=Pseudomonas sp. sp1636 TaxID=3036707 RepID=UPI0025A5D71C|nr:tetratricopeptide repeat protein [Pseudomonas sp. sp1636]MDM8348917.1 tetratricopeptide repeat protein [Pseudomonas sp. sp1636]